MTRWFGAALLATLLIACASPSSPSQGTQQTAHGPAVDLAGFVVTDDLSVPSGDLAGPKDLASTGNDLAHAGDLAGPHDMASGGGTCPGGVTPEGSCTGDTLKYCDNGSVVTVDCFWDYFGATCKVVNGVADCYF